MSKEAGNQELFELMTKMYSEMQVGFKEVRSEVNEVRSEVNEVRNEVKKTNTKIDHEVMPKIDALFDGYKQNSNKLDRIEEEVAKHEEIILRRIK